MGRERIVDFANKPGLYGFILRKPPPPSACPPSQILSFNVPSLDIVPPLPSKYIHPEHISIFIFDSRVSMSSPVTRNTRPGGGPFGLLGFAGESFFVY